MANELQFFLPVSAGHLQTHPQSPGFWGPITETPYKGNDCLARLKSKTEVVYQPLKGLFAFGGKAQLIFHLKLHML